MMHIEHANVLFLRKIRSELNTLHKTADKTTFFFATVEEKLSVTRKVLFRLSVSPITFELQAEVAFFRKFDIFIVSHRK